MKKIMIFGLLLMLASAALADVYTVGDGQDYQDLKSLYDSGALQSGDTVILYNDDSSLAGQVFAVSGVTIKSAGEAGKIIYQGQSNAVNGGILNLDPAVNSLKLDNITFKDASAGNVTYINTGRGGAIYSATTGSLDMKGSEAVSFVSNTAVGQSASSSGQGGAIYSKNGLSMAQSRDVLFQGNRALGGDSKTASANSLASARGGAVYGGSGTVDFSGSGNVAFVDNLAQGGVATEAGGTGQAGYGGAIYTDNSFLAVGSQSMFFNSNLAAGGDTSGSAGATHSGYGGAVYAKSIDMQGAEDIYFVGNRASGGDTSSSTSISSGRGGAIYVKTDASFESARNIVFEGNSAAGGNVDGGGASSSGLGGAIMASGALNFNHTENVIFTNNRASGGDVASSGAAYMTGSGGAIYNKGAVVSITDASNIVFAGNTAASGSSGSGSVTQSGHGGAVYAGTVDLSNTEQIRFMDNTAYGGTAQNGANASISGRGGAIHGIVNLSNTTDVLFSGNRAIGGNANDAGSSAKSSGQGGALYSSKIEMGNAQGLIFEGNHASGGKASDGGNADNSGLGGAAFLYGSGIFTGVAFLNNHAFSANEGDASSGRGGAVFLDSNASLTLQSSAGRDIIFSGNMDTNGSNSIYFGNTSTVSASQSLVLDVSAGSQVLMLDAMASQEDGLSGKSGTSYGNTSVTVDKNGDGLWVLGGHNDMRSASVWNINQGGLQLVNGENGPAHIDLSHTGTAEFNMTGGKLSLTPGLTPHKVTANDIVLSSSSTVGLAGFSYGDMLESGNYEILKLDAANLTNDSRIEQDSGVLTIGAYDYGYSDTLWSADGTTLSTRIRGRSLNMDRGGVPAVVAPTVLTFYSPFTTAVEERTAERFIQGNSGWWMTSAAASGSQEEAAGRPAYDVYQGGLVAGIDQLEGDFFGGMAYGYSGGRYSGSVDIDVDSLSTSAYGGVRLSGGAELTFSGGFTASHYIQKRSVLGEIHHSSYKSRAWTAGAELAQNITLSPAWSVRPFAGYRYTNLLVNGYREDSSGSYGLSYDGHREQLHTADIGASLTWKPARETYIGGKLFYRGNFGDTEAGTEAFFVNDPFENRFVSSGYALERSSLGLALKAGITVDRAALSAGYTVLAGSESMNHAAGVDIQLNW